jgi:hypothetical protein
MPKALFLSEQKLKDSSVINENVDPKVLSPIIAKIQELRMHEILGTALYNDLMDKIAVDADLVSYPDYKTLVTDYIQPCMIQYCMADGTPEMLVKYMNNSVSKKNTANAQPISFDEAAQMMEKYKADAEMYQERLINYLIDFAVTLFPLYLFEGTGISYIYPKRITFTSSLFLENNDNKNRIDPGDIETMQGGPCFP